MKSHRLISWLAVAAILVAALACRVTPGLDEELSATPTMALPTETAIPPTPTVQAIEASPFRGLFPSDVEITPDGSRAYVPCYGSNNV